MDRKLFDVVNGLAGRSAALDAAVVLLNRAIPAALVALLLALWFFRGSIPSRERRQRGVLIATAATTVALGFNQLLLLAWKRPRPFSTGPATLLLPPSTDPSFPSDHATFGFAIGIAIAASAPRAGIPALALGALLSFCRVFAGEHYPGDVLGGAVIGGLAALLVGRARFVDPFFAALLRLARRLRLA